LRAIDHKAELARARAHSLDGQIARLTQERQSYQNMMQQPDNAKLLTEVAALNKLFDEKAFSWTLAMEDLETVLPGGVQVSTLEPVPDKTGNITLHLKVIGPRDRAVELVRNLEYSRRFRLPRIVGENSDVSSGPIDRLEPVSATNRVSFDLLADYNSEAPIEHKTSRKPLAEGDRPASKHAAHPRQAASQFAPAQTTVRPPYTGPASPGTKPRRYPAPGGPQ
jgi:type IV pilus assembly protein PilN